MGIRKKISKNEKQSLPIFFRFFFAGDATLPILLVTNVVLQQQQ